MLNKYGKQDMEKLEIKYRFLKDILVAWSYANFKDEISYLGKEFIWNNTNFNKKQSPFYFTIGWRKALSLLNINMTIETNGFIVLMKSQTVMMYLKLIFSAIIKS